MLNRAAFTTGFACLIAANLCTAAWAEAGWSIFQQAAKGSPMAGATIFITPSGMRTNEPKSGLNFFTKGPAWGVVMYNTQTKNIYQTNLRTWMQSLAQRKTSKNRFEGATWKRGGETTIAGVRAYEFVLDKLPAAKGMVKGPDGRMRPAQSITGAKLYVAADIQTPTEVSNLISKIYGVPDCQRIPLKLIVNEAGMPRPTIAMDTIKVARVEVPNTMFTAPTGYKPVKSDMEVFIDKESMDALDDMMKDL